MVDYSVFDSILDSAFVIDGSGQVVYANDAATSFCQISHRRLVGKSNICDLFSLSVDGIFPFSPRSPGWQVPTAFIETQLKMKKSENEVSVQLAIRPLASERWVLFVRDVSLENSLHSKYRAQLREKEEYAKNLEKIVDARTAELRNLNQSLNAILNSLGQGFFTFDRAGKCGSVYTKACQEILGLTPANMQAIDVFCLDHKDRQQFQSWATSLFNEVLPFEELSVLGPSRRTLGDHRQVEFEYHPIRTNDGVIQDVVVVATDKTTEIEAQRALEWERMHATMVVRYVKNKFQFLQFLRSARANLEMLRTISKVEMSLEVVHECFRTLHTLEGEAGIFSIRFLRDGARNLQSKLAGVRESQSRLVGSELAEFNAEVVNLQDSFESFLSENRDVFQLPKGEVSPLVEVPLKLIEDLIKDLRSGTEIVKWIGRFEDIFFRTDLEDHLRHYDGLAQSVAEKLGKRLKPVQFDCSGIRLRIDPYRKLFSSLVHAFRNAVDHGIEPPEEREWSGKNREGEIKVCASIVDSQMILTVGDDGRGIDPQIVREKWSQNSDAAKFLKLREDELLQTIFEPGFSTKKETGEFSGRGVGLDALREEVLRLGGQVKVESALGMGTLIEIRVPILNAEDQLLRSA